VVLPLDQQVPARQQAGQGQLDDPGLAEQDLAGGVDDLFQFCMHTASPAS